METINNRRRVRCPDCEKIKTTRGDFSFNCCGSAHLIEDNLIKTEPEFKENGNSNDSSDKNNNTVDENNQAKNQTEKSKKLDLTDKNLFEGGGKMSNSKKSEESESEESKSEKYTHSKCGASFGKKFKYCPDCGDRLDWDKVSK